MSSAPSSTSASDAARRARFEATFAEVYEPLQRYVRRRCVPQSDADDVVSEALSVMWRRLDDVPIGFETAWVLGVARRCLANRHRGERRRVRLVERVGSELAIQEIADRDVPSSLDRAMALLSDDDRELLRLWAWEQLKPAEIAIAFDITPNAVSIRLHRAKRSLAELVERCAAVGNEAGRKEANVHGHTADGTTKEDRR